MIKNTLSSISLYTLSSLLCSLLSICALPFFTGYLTEKDYGISSLISTYVLILSPFLGVSGGGLFWIEFFKSKNKIEEKDILGKMFSTYFWFLTFSLFFFLILFCGLFPKIQFFLDFDLLFLLFIPFISYFIEISEFSKSLFVNKQKPKQYLLYSVLFTFLELSLSYVFIIYFIKSWEGRILGWLFSLLIQYLFTLYFFAKVEKLLFFIFDKAILLKIVIFGLPIIFHQIGKFVINQSDRIFISKMVSVDEAGVYSLGYQVGSMLLIPVGAFFNFYTPFLYEKLSNLNQENKIKIVKTAYFLGILTIICLVFLNLLAPFFFSVFIDVKFHTGEKYVFWVSLSYFFWFLYLIFSGILFYYKKTFFLGVISIVNVIINLILNYIFIRIYGAIGATYATAISFFIVFLFTYLKSTNILKLPWLNFNSSKLRGNNN